MIIERMQITEEKAFNSLYCSQLYAALDDEATKIWTYSVPRLFSLYSNEVSTGKLELPDY